MKTVSVTVKADYLERLARVKPVPAVAELVWNGFDADAKTVEVVIDRNELGLPDRITVKDDGSGIKPNSVEQEFANLGGSWKQFADRTRQERRALHGKGGQGRFRVFALGSHAKWTTRVKVGKRAIETVVEGYIGSLGKFDIDDSREVENIKSGTEVVVTEIRPDAATLVAGDRAVQEIAVLFAPYLRQYPSVTLLYDGEKVDADSVVEREDAYVVDDVEIDGATRQVELTVLEWIVPIKRALYLCDENGFALAEQVSGIQAAGYDFTAYLKSDYFRELDQNNLIALGETHVGVSTMLEAGREVLKNHFRKRKAEDASRVVEDWKRDDIYPFAGAATSDIETTERKVFDVVAYNVSKHLPDFEKSDPRTRKFQFYLLRQALERNPESLQRILYEVLELPKDAQNDLASLLEKTSLTHVIGAAKEVSNRLNFLRALEILVYEKKNELKERKELHRILAEETWIFGEEFNLSVDDQSLTEVLKKHLGKLDYETDPFEPVTRLDGSKGIVDLMLSRRIPQPASKKREHLVIELKRPSQAIDAKVLQQIRNLEC
jgi:hypothetical protein